MSLELPSFAEEVGGGEQSRDLWDVLGELEQAVAEIEKAVLSRDLNLIDRFRLEYPKVLSFICSCQYAVETHPLRSGLVASWRCRLKIMEALMKIGEGCLPSMSIKDKRATFEKARYFLLQADRQRAAVAHDARYEWIVGVLKILNPLRIARLGRTTRIPRRPLSLPLKTAAEAYRILGQKVVAS